MADEGDSDEAPELLGVRLAVQSPGAVTPSEDSDVGHRAHDETTEGQQNGERICRQERHGRSVARRVRRRNGR